jgi:N-methylhydantoinase A
MVPFSPDYCEQFHQLHEQTYGYSNRHKQIEIVNVRLRALGKPQKPEFPQLAYLGEELPSTAIIDRREVIFDGQTESTAIIDRNLLGYGNRIQGPAIIVEYSSTIVVPPFASGHVDSFGNIILQITA